MILALLASGVLHAPLAVSVAVVPPTLTGVSLPAPGAVEQEWVRRPTDPTDKDLRSAWDELEPAKKREIAEWFRLEVGGLQSFQAFLINYVIRAREKDAGSAPEARPPRYFDPEEHAPKLPIARTWLKPGSSKVEQERERLLGKNSFPRTLSSWAYDWGQGQLVRAGEGNDPEVVFHNGLMGLAPDADLAMACVLEVLDTGTEQVLLEAFGHTYTDREGNAYSGITLYDAWGSGRRLEMPDVDNLGIVHTVLKIKRKWRSPVPESKQESLYEAVAEQYVRARRFRGLREAMAAYYLGAEPPVPAGYETNAIRLHALWEEASSTPEVLAEELPSADKWEKYMERLLRRVDRDKDLIEKAKARQGRLATDQIAIRATLVRIMRESGAITD
ncbi:MAG: hypothetical protein ACI82F_003426 [Planctomycetota bacterium]